MSQSPIDSRSAASPMTSSSANSILPTNAPKYGTLVPNRIFVGGISCNTSEEELGQLFSAFGNVKSTKIISDRAGVSKGYGFVTFEQDEEAKRVLTEGERVYLRDRKLNIAPAIKKQPFNRSFEEPVGMNNTSSATYYYGTGLIPAGYNYHGGVIYYNAPAANPEQQIYQPLSSTYNSQMATAPYPLMYQCAPQPMLVHPGYVPQPYQPLQRNQASCCFSRKRHNEYEM